MKFKIALFTVFLALGAAQHAAAQEHPDVIYQKSLLARTLSVTEKNICDGIVGAGNASAHEACHVTRLFLSDIRAGKAGDDNKRFPPMAHIKYTSTVDEKQLIADRI